MASRSICVTDTNLWIDLDTAGLLDPIFRLPLEWHAPDVIVAELERPEGAALVRRGLVVRELAGAQVAHVIGLARRHLRPSRADLFALALAYAERALLVTGDRHLRQAAEQEGLPVHGTLWVLDTMVAQTVLSPREAASALIRMRDARRRLPNEEVDRRLRRWREE
jgi:predicted nucleic acid-binding protein